MNKKEIHQDSLESNSVRYQRIAINCMVAVLVISFLGFISWFFKLSFQSSLIQSLTIANPLALINLFFFSIAFLILHQHDSSKIKSWVAYFLLFLVTLASLSVVVDFILGSTLHLDQLLWSSKMDDDKLIRSPQHMAFNTAKNIIISCVALFILRRSTKAIIHQLLGLWILVSAIFVLLGRLYKVPEFSQVNSLQVAPSVAICFVLIALALLLIRPNEGIVQELTSSSGSWANRYLIPSILLIPILIGYVRMLGHWYSRFSLEFGVTLIIMSFIIIFGVVVWTSIAWRNRRDEERRQFEIELASLNHDLKNANEELATLNEELRSSNEEMLASNEELQANNEALIELNENLDKAHLTIARQKDEQLNRVLDSSLDVIWSFDLTGTGQNYLSRSAERIYNEPIERLIERPRFWLEHLYPADKPIKDASQQRLEKFGSTECTYRIELASGIRWIHDRLKLIRDTEGKPVRLEGIATDVTSERESEQKVLQAAGNLDAILKSTRDGFLLLDENYMVKATNESYREIVKQISTREIIIGNSILSVVPENRREFFQTQLLKAKENGIVQYDVPSDDQWYNTVITPVWSGTNIISGYCIAIHNVTAQKRSENLLRINEERIRALVEHGDDLIALRDLNGKVLFSSSNFKRILGHDTWDAEYRQVIHPEDLESFNQKISNIKNQPGESFHASIRVLHKNGSWRWLEGITTNLCHLEAIGGIISNYRDVTERKNHEQTLKQYREDLEIVFDNSSDNFILLDADAKVVHCNKSFRKFAEKFTGITPKPGISYYDVLPANQREANKEIITNVLQGEAIHTLEHVERNGEIGYLDIRYRPVFHEGEITHITISALDVTEQKKQEILATSYRENLDIIFQNSTDFFILLNPQTQIVLFNKSFLDYTRDLVKKPAYFGMNYLDIISPNRIEVVKDILAQCLRGERFDILSETVWPSGIKYFNVRYSPVIQNDVVTFITISSTDITEQKKQEIIAERYRENLDIIFNNTVDQFELMDVSGKVVLFNKAFSNSIIELTTIAPTDGMHFLDIIPSLQREMAQSLFNKAVDGELVELPIEIPFKTGVKYFDVRLIPIRKDGRVTHVCRTATDITSKKINEAKLNEFRESLEIIFSNTTDGFLLVDTNWKVVSFNRSYEELIWRLVKIKAGIGLDFLDVIPPQRRPLAKLLFETALSGESTYREVDFEDAEGVSLCLQLKYQPVFRTGVVTHVTISVVNITDRKNKEILLEKSEASFKSILNSTLEGFLLLNSNYEIVTLNERFKILFKHSQSEIATGMNVFEIFSQDREWVVKSYFDKVKKGDVVTYQKRFSMEGKVTWLDVAITPVITAHHEFLGYCMTLSDITADKETEELLKQNQYFLDKASEAAKLGYWTSEIDKENGKLTWSKEVFNIFQMDEKDFDGKNTTFFDLIHPDDRLMVSELARLAKEENQVYDIDHRIMLKDGQIRWVNERAQFVRNEKNEATLMVGIIQDINDRKIIEQVLREYNDRYEILSKATNDVIYDWNVEKDDIKYNHGITTVLGYSINEISNALLWWGNKLHPDDHDPILNEIKDLFEKKLPNGIFNYRFMASGGDYKFISDRAYVVYDSTGKPLRMIGAMQDVTELTEYRMNLEKKVEQRTQELQVALQKEKELVELRSKFVSVASHEFRTPLSTISLASGFIKKFKNKMTTEDIDKKLDSVATQVKHMTLLLDDVLTFGKGEAGKIQVNLVNLTVHPLFENIVQEVTESTMGTHRINLKIDCSFELFKTDEALIRNITINFLTNAIKFSPQKGEIDFTVKGNKRLIVLSIRDYGVGIPSIDIPKLFQPFFRAENATNIKGTGLGLSIVKNAVDLLKGQISVKSDLGKGTEFIVTLPFLV